MGKVTVQGLFDQHKNDLLDRLNLPLHQLKAFDSLSSCRTANLGGHVQRCQNGHLNGVWYNSCKHRSCPQCRSVATEEWLLNTKRLLLECPHHHVVFNIPQELRVVCRYNRALMTGLLFKAAQHTLLKFSNDPKYLGATPGILSAYHNWGRNLSENPHVHVLITHGGLDSAGNWVRPKKEILFPQAAVMKVFRGKLLDSIRNALNRPDFSFPEDLDITRAKKLLNKLGRVRWATYFCERYDHGGGVAKYLARYVKRGPLNNGQLVNLKDDRVTFRYQSHTTKRLETMNLSVEHFTKRLLEHVPPARQARIRYCGLYSPSSRSKLNTARESLGQEAVTERMVIDWMSYLEDRGKLPLCKECQQPLMHRETLERERWA